MTRKEILTALYEKIGGVDAGWISDFQNLRHQKVGNPELTESIRSALDNMADWCYHFEDLDAVIQYEKMIQKLYDSIYKRIESLIAKKNNNEILKELRSDLEDDVVEAIKISYITLNANYQTYVDKAEELYTKIDSLES